MAVEPLSSELKLAGAAMLRELDGIGLHPQGVLWLHFHTLNDWRLTIVTDLIDVVGRLKVYRLVDQALEKHGPIEGLTVFDIHLASSQEVLPRVLGGDFLFEGGSGGVELINSTVNGVLVDAFIYRLTRARSADAAAQAAKQFERRIKDEVLA